MKIVLDTNVVVSAFLVPSGKPAVILRLAVRGELQLCFNTAILAEYEEVLSRSKFAGKVALTVVRRFFDILHDKGEDVIISPSSIALLDESDRVFYDVALAAGATLITGNTKHYPDDVFITTPTQFLQWWQIQ